MIDQIQSQKLYEIFDKGLNIALVFPSQTKEDVILSSYAFYLFCKNLWRDKQIYLISPTPKEVQVSHEVSALIDSQKIQNSLPKENFVLSFPYDPEKIDQVFSQISEDHQKFFITIKPKAGIAPIEFQEIQHSYSSSQNLIFVLLGVNQLAEVPSELLPATNLQKNEQSVITINNFLPDFGTLNLDISGSSSYCEALFFLMKNLANLAAKDWQTLLENSSLLNLVLYGIEKETQSFTKKNTSALTFLATAELLQNGAERLLLANSQGKKPTGPKKKA